MLFFFFKLLLLPRFCRQEFHGGTVAVVIAPHFATFHSDDASNYVKFQSQFPKLGKTKSKAQQNTVRPSVMQPIVITRWTEQ